jgi:ABC-type multidrug transport system ATPase subunit
MLTGVIRPDSGSTRINGTSSPTDAAARMVIGVAPQNLSL